MPRASEREYYVPERLSDLRGPSEGSVEIPWWVYWGPGEGRLDASRRDSAIAAYPEILREGSKADIERLVNPSLLVSVWRDLLLPRSLRPRWESRFPELRG